MPEAIKRYRISKPAPAPVRLSHFGIARDEAGADAAFTTTFEGMVSAAEYRQMYGAEADITTAMIHQSYDRDGWAVKIGVADVLAAENEAGSMQSVIISALREQEGLAPLTGREAAAQALGHGEIAPEAALFLMQMYSHAFRPEEVRVEQEMQRLQNAGLGLRDFCRT